MFCRYIPAVPNTDGRRTVEKGKPANFFVYYEIDEDEVKTVLRADEYDGDGDGSWVLLEATGATDGEAGPSEV